MRQTEVYICAANNFLTINIRKLIFSTDLILARKVKIKIDL